MMTMRCHWHKRLGHGKACIFWAILCAAWSGLLVTSVDEGARAQTPAEPTEVQLGKVLQESWDALYLEGVKSGYVHHRFQEVSIRGRAFIWATSSLELTVKRFGQLLTMSLSVANYETPTGQVASITIAMQVGRDQRIVRRGTVLGQELVMQVQFGQQPPREVRIPWTPEALGLYTEERFFTAQDWSPGQERSYIKFVPELDRFVRSYVKAEEYEVGPHTRGGKWLRLRQRFDKVANLEVPDVVLWLDEQKQLARQETVWPGLGKMTLVRTTKEHALAPAGAPSVDIGFQHIVRLPERIPNAVHCQKIVYRLQMRSGEFPEGLFPQDERQRLLRREAKLIELEVLGSVVPPVKGTGTYEPPAEYLRSNQVVNSEDKLVQELARRAVGAETDPWQKALRIERWVHANMKRGTFTEAFASADEVARTRVGDCTEHAVLAAAMCRAVGVPSRLVMGLAYVEQLQALVPHMWLEAWIAGRWYGLDPTLGRGSLPATHIKISHHSWNDVTPLRPLAVFRTLFPHLAAEALRWE